MVVSLSGYVFFERVERAVPANVHIHRLARGELAMRDANFNAVCAVEKLNCHYRQRARRAPLSVVVPGKSNPLVGFHIRIDPANADACSIASLQPCPPGTAGARINLTPLHSPRFGAEPANKPDRIGPRLEQERT